MHVYSCVLVTHMSKRRTHTHVRSHPHLEGQVEPSTHTCIHTRTHAHAEEKQLYLLRCLCFKIKEDIINSGSKGTSSGSNLDFVPKTWIRLSRQCRLQPFKRRYHNYHYTTNLLCVYQPEDIPRRRVSRGPADPKSISVEQCHFFHPGIVMPSVLVQVHWLLRYQGLNCTDRDKMHRTSSVSPTTHWWLQELWRPTPRLSLNISYWHTKFSFPHVESSKLGFGLP